MEFQIMLGAETPKDKENNPAVIIPPNQAELLRLYRAEFENLKPKTLQTILELREKYQRLGMAI